MNTTTTRAVSRWVILMLALGAGFSVASIYYAQPLLPLMGSDLNLSIEGMGMVPTLTQAGYALGILFLLPLGDRHDRRTLILIKSAALALFLLGAAFIAVTLFISSLTENQVVAAVVGMIVLLALALIDVVARYAESVPVVPTVLNALSFYTRYYDFTAGLFDPASVLFYVSTAVIFNFFTVRVFEKRRWS